MLTCMRVALTAAILVTVLGTDNARAETSVGFGSALTGPYTWVGEPHLVGTELAVVEVNAAGGVLGEPLELIVADDACHPEQAVAAAQKLASVSVAVVFSATCSGAAIPASKVYHETRIPMIEAAATNPRLTDEGRPGIFRIVGRDDLQGVIAGNFLADRWPNRKVAIIHDGQVYGKGLAEEVKKQLTQRGVKEAVYASYVPGALDYSDLLDELQTASIEVLYVGGYSPEIGLIIRQARDRGYDVQLVAGDGLSTSDFWLVAGEAGEGTLFTAFNDPTRNPRAAEVMERLQAQAGEANIRALYSYAAVQVWTQAVEEAGTVEPAAVTRVLHESEFDTILGRIGFDEKGDVTGYEPFVWYIWSDGKYERLEEQHLDNSPFQ